MPGPPVAVCEGDLLSVEVNNHLHTETTTMHFHGTFLKSTVENVIVHLALCNVARFLMLRV